MVPGLEVRGAWGAVPPPPNHNIMKVVPSLQTEKKKNVFIKFPQNATKIPSGTTPPEQPPAQFLVHVAAMCAAVPTPRN